MFDVSKKKVNIFDSFRCVFLRLRRIFKGGDLSNFRETYRSHSPGSDPKLAFENARFPLILLRARNSLSNGNVSCYF